MDNAKTRLNVLSNERGQALALTGIFILALVAFGALAINVGHQAHVANELQILADAAAAGAAQAAIQAIVANSGADGMAETEAASVIVAQQNLVDGKVSTGGLGSSCTPGANACVAVRLGHYNGSQFVDSGTTNAAQAEAFAQAENIIPGFMTSPGAIHKTATAAFTSIGTAQVGGPHPTLPFVVAVGDCPSACAYNNNGMLVGTCNGTNCVDWGIGCNPLNATLLNGNSSYPAGQFNAAWTGFSQGNTGDGMKSFLPGAASPQQETITAGHTTVTTLDPQLGTNTSYVDQVLDAIFDLFGPSGPWILDNGVPGNPATKFVVPVIDAACPAAGTGIVYGGTYSVVGFVSITVTQVCSADISTCTADSTTPGKKCTPGSETDCLDASGGNAGCPGACADGSSQGRAIKANYVANIIVPYTPGGSMINSGTWTTGSGASGTTGDFGTGYIILVSDNP